MDFLVVHARCYPFSLNTMADDDGLDDFFAKKDKKGKSKKNKFTPAEILEEGTTQTQKTEKPKKKKKPKEKSDASKSDGTTKAEDVEEWIEVDDEEVNYSGLKIKTLQIVDEAEQDRDTQEQVEDEDGESPGSRSTQGPWSGAAQPTTESAPAASDPIIQPEEKTEEPTVKAPPGKYIPPSVRKAMAESASSPAATSMRRGQPRQAPDIQSQMHFPSLGETSSTGDRLREKEFERENPKSRFEMVKSGNRQLEDSSKRGLKLEIENKFDLLQDN